MSINKSEKGTNNIDDLIYPQQYVKKKATETNISCSHLFALSPQSECLEQANF